MDAPFLLALLPVCGLCLATRANPGAFLVLGMAIQSCLEADGGLPESSAWHGPRLPAVISAEPCEQCIRHCGEPGASGARFHSNGGGKGHTC